MKLLSCTIFSAVGLASAFQPALQARSATSLNMGFDLSGNSWKPDSEKMGSTDTGDYYPEGYDPNEVAFNSGMMGSQAMLNNDRSGPELPGMENLGADAVMMGGLEQNSEIPSDMDFTPPSILDGEYNMNVAASSSGEAMRLSVQSPCMTFEDYYAAFAPGSHPAFSVSPAVGRMDRRSGEPTDFEVKCTPNGASGDLVGTLVINLPDDNTKIAYKFTAKSF